MLDTIYKLVVYDGVTHPGQVVWDGLAVDRAQQIHVLAHDMTALPAVRARGVGCRTTGTKPWGSEVFSFNRS